MEEGDVLVGSEVAVTAMLAIAGGAVVIGNIAGGGVDAVNEGHVAFTAGDGFAGIAGMIPAAVFPTVVLVLSLNLADVGVDDFVDVLFVTGGAVFRGFVEVAGVGLEVFAGVGADEEVTHLLGEVALLEFIDIALRGLHGVVAIALDVGLGDGVAEDAGGALLGSFNAEGNVAFVFGAAEKGDGIVAPGAVAGVFGGEFPGHELLDPLEHVIHGGIAVGAGEPLFVDFGVAPAGAAPGRPGEGAGVDGPLLFHFEGGLFQDGVDFGLEFGRDINIFESLMNLGEQADGFVLNFGERSEIGGAILGGDDLFDFPLDAADPFGLIGAGEGGGEGAVVAEFPVVVVGEALDEDGVFIEPGPGHAEGEQEDGAADGAAVEGAAGTDEDSFGFGIVHLADDDRQQVDDDEDGHGEAGDEVDEIPEVGHFDAEPALPGDDDPGNYAASEKSDGDIAQELIMAEVALFPDQPVADGVPDHRDEGDEADDGVDKNAELSEFVEGPKEDHQPAESEVEESCPGEGGEHRFPLGGRVDAGAGFGQGRGFHGVNIGGGGLRHGLSPQFPGELGGWGGSGEK